jgi:hypothetical protein
MIYLVTCRKSGPRCADRPPCPCTADLGKARSHTPFATGYPEIGRNRCVQHQKQIRVCNQLDTETNIGTRHFCITSNVNFFYATDLGRFLDPFEDAEYALGIGGLLDNYDNKKCRARPCVASQ